MTDITRWQIHPGDRLIVKLAVPLVTDQVAYKAAMLIRRRLNLPSYLPVMVIGEGEDIKVIHG